MSVPGDGYVVVDKPAGWTSHDVVARARHVLAQRRIGHGGTLDPDATGVLVLAVGRATRLLRYVSGLPKSYVGEVVLGVATSTLDASGEIVATYDMSGVTLEQVRQAAATLTGKIAQVPPMVSALQVGGRRLYELAREGVEIERQARPVEVERFDVQPTALVGIFQIHVQCSSGTYVRSLASELGERLGGGAHLRHLRRDAVGGFRIEEAVRLDELSAGTLHPAAGLVGHLPSIVVADELADRVGHGRVLERRVLGVSGDGPWALLDPAGALMAIYEVGPGDRVKPAVVLADAAGSPPAARGGMRPDAGAPARPDGLRGWDPAAPPSAAQAGIKTGVIGGKRASVVSAGTFDGVHRGHRKVIESARRIADERNVRLVALTFDRHPLALLRPADAPGLLTTVEQKVELLRAAGVDEVAVIAFDEAQARRSAEEFVTETLVGELGAVAVVVGANFRFGRGRVGDLALLHDLGARLGFDAVGVDLLSLDGEPVVSSSRIRALIAAGNLFGAARLLGRPYEIRGVTGADHELQLPAGIVLPPSGRYPALVGAPGAELQALNVEVGAGGDLATGVRIDPHVSCPVGAELSVRFVGDLVAPALMARPQVPSGDGR